MTTPTSAILIADLERQRDEARAELLRARENAERIMITRRGFLKLGTALVGGVALARYTEIDATIHPHRDWIRDEGNYYIVRIPDYKTISKEVFDKPVLLLAGRMSVFTNCVVNGFVNFGSGNGTFIDNCIFDARGCVADVVRPVFTLHRNTADTTISNCSFHGRGIGISFIGQPSDDNFFKYHSRHPRTSAVHSS